MFHKTLKILFTTLVFVTNVLLFIFLKVYVNSKIVYTVWILFSWCVPLLNLIGTDTLLLIFTNCSMGFVGALILLLFPIHVYGTNVYFILNQVYYIVSSWLFFRRWYVDLRMRFRPEGNLFTRLL